MDTNHPSKLILELFDRLREPALGRNVVLLQTSCENKKKSVSQVLPVESDCSINKDMQSDILFSPFLHSYLTKDLSLVQFASSFLNGLDPIFHQGLVCVHLDLIVGRAVPSW